VIDMDDMKCPYCGAGCEVCHDDGHGYSEDDLHEHECWSCEKKFVFRTSIILSYDPSKADCMNGHEHDWHPTFTFPIERTEGHCKSCGLIRAATPNDMSAAVAYRARLKILTSARDEAAL
jgi:hypothetical protein